MPRTAKLIIVLLVALIVVGVVATVITAQVLLTLSREQAPPSVATAQAVSPTSSPVVAPPPALTPPGEALTRIRKRGVLMVGTDTGTPAWVGSPPSFFLNDKGEPDGFDYQLARHIAATVGVAEVKIVHHLYDDFEAALTGSADLDLIIGGFTPYAAPGIAWSDPYLEYGLCLVVRADDRIETTADLTGKVVGIYEDDAAEAEVKKLVKGYKALRRLDAGYWDQLVNRQLDAYLYDYPFAIAEIKTWYTQNPHRVGSLRIAQYNLTDSTYAVAVRKDDTDLLARINEAIASWRASDAYGIAVRQYLSDEELPKAEAEGSYVVAAGDTLSQIANQKLGDAGRWREIWVLNKDRFASPNLIEVGDTLVLPGE